MPSLSTPAWRWREQERHDGYHNFIPCRHRITHATHPCTQHARLVASRRQLSASSLSMVDRSQIESATVSAPPTVRLTRPTSPQPVACLRTRVHSKDARNCLCMYSIAHTGDGGDQPEVALCVHLTQAQPPTPQDR
jgi:hypothetical protein